ncbi:hypothetical protein fugu_019981 [Takifugu bimaculatus]|uniref:Peroxisome assembly protein 26 n=1 Tax=Takifugu bimaculatus TaxID=433685 RepID=A0A4Z2BGU4_9TELE|nr:hypothetical protein fugu_019981 [Takifugu bimaculatus]
MSKCSDTAGNAHSWGYVCSPPPTSSLMKTFSLLETAAEQMMVHTDFQAAFGTCNKGLEGLASMELEDNRCLEYKAGFCTVGIQALAELNQWRAALPWVLQQYEDQEKIPAQIVQLCILLYSKVGEPAVMQETARVWLHCPSNRSVSGFRTVAELYLLHVLVPLKYREEAEELILGEIGTSVFTEHQRQTALEILEEKEQQNQELPLNSSQNSTADVISARGSVLCKVEAMLKFLYRKLLLTHSWLIQIPEHLLRGDAPLLAVSAPGSSSSILIHVDFQTIPAAQTDVEDHVCTVLSGHHPEQRTVGFTFSDENKISA